MFVRTAGTASWVCGHWYVDYAYIHDKMVRSADDRSTSWIGQGSSLGVFVYGVHSSIAWGMPKPLTSIAQPGSGAGDGERVDTLGVL